jgi:hypothetical protein
MCRGEHNGGVGAIEPRLKKRLSCAACGMAGLSDRHLCALEHIR